MSMKVKFDKIYHDGRKRRLLSKPTQKYTWQPKRERERERERDGESWSYQFINHIYN